MLLTHGQHKSPNEMEKKALERLKTALANAQVNL